MKVLGAVLAMVVLAAGPARGVTFSGPTSSQPIALDAAGEVLAVVNPDTDTVSLFNVTGDTNRRIRRLPVQDEPWGVAILPDASKVYVANTVSGTVTVITRRRTRYKKPELHIPVGTEPYALALTPNGTRLFVANARSNDISVIDTATDTVVATIANVGPEPRGLAITNDGDSDDGDEILWVTQFLALPIPGRLDGADNAKAGHLSRISVASNMVLGDVVLNPIGSRSAASPPGTPSRRSSSLASVRRSRPSRTCSRRSSPGGRSSRRRTASPVTAARSGRRAASASPRRRTPGS